MKTLTESILGSNGAGVKAQVTRWCEENLKNGGVYSWSVDDKGRISGKIGFQNDYDNEFPNGTRWGRVRSMVLRGMKSLKNIPIVIDGDFICVNSPDLKNFDGCPQEVYGNFYWFNNGTGTYVPVSKIDGICMVTGVIKTHPSSVRSKGDIILYRAPRPARKNHI